MIGLAARVKDRIGPDLRIRLISSVALATPAAVALWLGGWFSAALAALTAGAMAYEWRTIASPPLTHPRTHSRAHSGPLSGPPPDPPSDLRAADGLFVAAAVATPLAALALGLGWAMAVVSLGLVAVLVLDARRSPAAPPRWATIAGLPLIALACACFVWLREYDQFGLSVCVWLMLVVAAADIGGYFAGRLIGGPKAPPRISPKKTWAGLIGGVALAAGTGAVFSGLTTGTFFHEVGVVSMIAALVAQGGDIAESAYKRRFGAKDSGRLIPGHGGALDRVDGLSAAALVTAAFTAVRGKEIFVW